MTDCYGCGESAKYLDRRDQRDWYQCEACNLHWSILAPSIDLAEGLDTLLRNASDEHLGTLREAATHGQVLRAAYISPDYPGHGCPVTLAMVGAPLRGLRLYPNADLGTGFVDRCGPYDHIVRWWDDATGITKEWPGVTRTGRAVSIPQIDRTIRLVPANDPANLALIGAVEAEMDRRGRINDSVQ